MFPEFRRFPTPFFVQDAEPEQASLPNSSILDTDLYGTNRKKCIKSLVIPSILLDRIVLGS